MLNCESQKFIHKLLLSYYKPVWSWFISCFFIFFNFYSFVKINSRNISFWWDNWFGFETLNNYLNMSFNHDNNTWWSLVAQLERWPKANVNGKFSLFLILPWLEVLDKKLKLKKILVTKQFSLNGSDMSQNWINQKIQYLNTGLKMIGARNVVA